MSTYTRTTTFGSLSAGNQAASKFDTEFDNIKTAVDDNYSIAASKEASLGNPAEDGYLLSSLADGTRSWVAPADETAPQTFDNIEVFSSSGTWTRPTGITKVIVEAWGGGGGGGGGNSTPHGGAGGGSGAYGYGIYSSISGNISVTIGSGGTGGGTGSTGNSGSTTTVSGGGMPSGCTCAGGSGGAHYTASGGAGGSAGAGWNLGIDGQRGGGSSAGLYGAGGSSPRGGGGGAGGFPSITTGYAGNSPGGGGGGGGTSTGGAGASGKVIIRW